ncbi:hypothetical protein VB715_12625 [Crocosphaera sp. UHCC 0190]|uniref:DUF6883 domain-containing protein n=1 Tax=Crocosphaera sp. UHCC 0190 TaxID=3110246 RepID=UPI002B20D4DA|nr:DUF6883 domain-containing protein [Crocosphaera sp. UHCC 0190]MEA5510610.1 hypothetical protein [Crocosphaera sp. UHCC 0190]
MDQNSQSSDPLPMARYAEIDPRKFTEYSMNPSNPNNQGKSKAFQALGYNIDSPQSRQIAVQLIINQIRSELEQISAILDEPSPYGTRFTVIISITGLNNRKGKLVTKWQIDNNQTIPRLITNWLEVLK